MQQIMEAAMSGVAHMAADLTTVEHENLSTPIDTSPPILYLLNTEISAAFFRPE